MNAESLKSALRKVIEALWPELGHRTHLPHKARVLAVRSSGGAAGPPGEVRYSVDLEPLTPDGRPDPRRPVLKDVPLDVPWIGTRRGVYALPEVGAVVRVGYYEGDPAYPYVDGVLSEGKEVAQVEPGEYLIQKSPETWVRLRPDGEILAQAAPNVLLRLAPDGTVEIRSTQRVRVEAPRVELAGGGPAVARVGDQVRVYGVAPGTATATGEIVSGSSRTYSG